MFFLFGGRADLVSNQPPPPRRPPGYKEGGGGGLVSVPDHGAPPSNTIAPEELVQFMQYTYGVMDDIAGRYGVYGHRGADAISCPCPAPIPGWTSLFWNHGFDVAFFCLFCLSLSQTVCHTLPIPFTIISTIARRFKIEPSFFPCLDPTTYQSPSTRLSKWFTKHTQTLVALPPLGSGGRNLPQLPNRRNMP